jgi:hypothetical protein
MEEHGSALSVESMRGKRARKLEGAGRGMCWLSHLIMHATTGGFRYLNAALYDLLRIT